MVTLFTKPGCAPCQAGKAWLEKKGVAHEVVDVEQNQEAKWYLQNRLNGQMAVPVLQVDQQVEAGFSIPRWEQLVGG